MPARNYSLDRLADYRTEAISEPLQVVNPDYRHLDGQVRSTTGKLNRRLANFAAITLNEPIEPKHVEPFLRRKASSQEEIEALQRHLDTLKAKRKETPHHIAIEELPEEVRFRQLSTQSKHLVDTIKMIAYRAETAMANSLREHLTRPDEARRLLCALYTTDADLLPDPAAGTLTVRLHHSANAATDQVIEKLCEELNATETVFPRTTLRLVLKWLSVNSSKSGHLNLEVGSGTQAEQTAAIMTRYERRLLEARSALCLVVGDVTSTMACAIAAQKLCVPVAPRGGRHPLG